MQSDRRGSPPHCFCDRRGEWEHSYDPGRDLYMDEQRSPSPASGTLPNIAIIGATTCTGSGSVASPIACTDNTIINSNGGLWYLEIGAGTTVRLSGISFESAAVTNGIVQVQGPTSGTVPQVRIDHVHGLLSSNADTAFAISAVTGVIDHSLLNGEGIERRKRHSVLLPARWR